MRLIKKYQIILLVAICAMGMVLRLYKISNPVADWHSWRQADTSAVTRNFVKYGINLLVPRYDDFSDVSNTGRYNPQGNRFVEFPLFNLFHVIFYSISPVGTLEEWGRLTSILAACVSAGSLFFLVRRRTTTVTGLLAAFFYVTLPYNIYFTRVILPDPLMVTLFLLSLNLYDIYEQKQTLRWLLFAGLFGALATLVKPVALFFLLPITYLQLKKYGFKVWKSKEFYILHSVFVLPFGAWRIWSYMHPEGVPYSDWLFNGNGIRFKGSFFQWIFGERLGSMILGKWGVWPALTGVVSGNDYMGVMAISVLLYVCTIATGNVQHDYYQIPIIPMVSMFLAIGAVRIWSYETSLVKTAVKRILLITSICFMFAFTWYDIRGLYQINNWSIVHAGEEIDQILPKDAVVIAPYQRDTAFLYQTNRRGFAYLQKPLKDMIDRFNAKYYVSVNYDDDTNEIMKKYTVMVQKPEYVIVKLEERLNQ